MTTQQNQDNPYSPEILFKVFAELREQQERTDKMLSARFAETDEQMKETDRFLSAKFAETDEQMKKTDEQMKETDRFLSAKFAETDRKLNKLGRLYGNMSNNNGEIAEEFFYSSFSKTRTLGSLHYDDIGRNWEKERDGIEEEYDIIMTNGNAIAVIEVKVKAHPEDVNALEKKVENFKKLFPIYKDYTVYGGLASLTMSKQVKSELLKKGLYAIKQQGNHVEVVSPK